MSIETTVVGSYPKPPHEGETFTLRKTLHAIERGEADATDLRKAQDDLVTQIIAEQEAAGIDIVTDGQVRWDDILTPFAKKMAGFEVGGLLRFFDNNTYYRRPVCVAKVEWRGPTSIEDFKFATSVTDGTVKAVIPGPVTFAHLSLDEYYSDHERFAVAIAEVLAQEAFELEAAGATLIQIDEPSLLGAPEDLDLAKRCLDIVTRELKEAETIVATYFGDAKRLGAEIYDLPVTGIGLDLIAGPENEALLDAYPEGKKMQLGIVDARNTRLEPVDDLARIIERYATKVGPRRLRVSPSAGLEYLPRDKARAKLERLTEAARKVGV
jgi:5-methyltetrahydropteroyltriglutamate--homocysteine methyltransferase